jgi:hypothetical protein
MGWNMRQPKQHVATSAKDKAKLAQRLFGCIQLSEDFDYKEELSAALSDKYRI